MAEADSPPMADSTPRCSNSSGGEYLDAVARDHHGVLELRGRPSVHRHDRPTVVPLHHIWRTEPQHRFDREHCAGAQACAVAGLVVVMHVRRGVELLADAMTDELAHDAKSLVLCDRLDGAPDVAHAAPGPHRIDTDVQAPLRDVDEVPGRGIDVADEERCRAVAVHAVEIDRDVAVDDVAGHERAVVGDPVRDDLVDRRADRLRKAAIAQRAGIATFGDVGVVRDGIERVRRDARRDLQADAVEHAAGGGACGSQSIHRSGVGERLQGAARRLARITHVVRPCDRRRNRPGRTQLPGPDRTRTSGHGAMMARHGAGCPTPRHAPPRSGACGPLAKSWTNCAMRGSLAEGTSNRCSHATTVIGESIPAYGVTSTWSCLAKFLSVCTSAADVFGSNAIHTAPCSSECTANSSGGCWS